MLRTMARVAIDLGDAAELPEVLTDAVRSVVAAPSELGDWVDFLEAGSDARGEFRCADCGYGVVVQNVLPSCPMCRGAVWERRESRFAC
jgi:rubrerythrin